MVIVVAVLTGCIPPPAIIEKVSAESPQITAGPLPLHPLNCGTPDEFKICPMPGHYHDAILIEPLPDSDPPDPPELEAPAAPQAPLPAPMPPVPPPPEAQ